MAKDDYDGGVVASGVWLYASTTRQIIDVVAFDCDYFHDRMPTDNGRSEWKPYPLNSAGVLYYLRGVEAFISPAKTRQWDRESSVRILA